MNKLQLRTFILSEIRNVIKELKYDQKKDYWVSVDKSELNRIKTSSNPVSVFHDIFKNFISECNKDKFQVTINGKSNTVHEMTDILNKLKTKPLQWAINQIGTNPEYNKTHKKFNITIDLDRIDPKYFKAMGDYGGLD